MCLNKYKQLNVPPINLLWNEEKKNNEINEMYLELMIELRSICYIKAPKPHTELKIP